MDIKKVLAEQLSEGDIIIYKLVKNNLLSLRAIAAVSGLTAGGVQARATRVGELLKKQGIQD